MHSMDHHLLNGDAITVELRSPMVGDSTTPETSYNDVPIAKQLPFHVVYYSGQDEDYPASELNNGVVSRGWQSSRFCYYPQEIVLELQWPSRIITMQLLSHESKIPTKVEVFVSLIVPYAHEAIDQWRRLGYLALDCNERSGHQARELKSVCIDSPATVVRLVFHNCHPNDYNAYNQVGLMALILTGEPLNEQQWALLTQPGFENLLQTPRGPAKRQIRMSSKPSEATMQGSSRNSPERKCDSVDLSTATRIIQLQEEKNSAVLDEDYDEAKRLKGLIDRLRALGEQIKQLENKKQLAVEDEDYDTAKSCKKEIEKLRLQEQLPDEYHGQAKKVDEVSDCGVSSEESVDEAHAAEGSSRDEPAREDLATTDCCDSDKKEFGTQTLPSVKNMVVKKLDKQISCKTPDLSPPPKYHAFIPAMIAPNILSDITKDDTYMRVLPTVSYKNGSSALLPNITHPIFHPSGLHSIFNETVSTKMAMTMNAYPSKQSTIIEHPKTFLKSLPTFYNKKERLPTSPIKNAMHQNNKPSFPTSNIKNVSLLSPILQRSFQEPIKNGNVGHKFSNVQNVNLCMEQLLSIQNEIVQNIEKQPRVQSNDYQILNSWFGALVKEYNEARNTTEQITRMQNIDQEVLNNQFGALVREYNEARNLAAIQSEEKEMRNQHMSNEQAIRDKVYNEQMMNDRYKNEKTTKEKDTDYCDHNMASFKNNERLSNMHNNGHKVDIFQSNEQIGQMHDNSREEVKTFGNKQMPKEQTNGYNHMNFENNGHVSKIQSRDHDELKNFQNYEKTLEIENSDSNEVKNFPNNIHMLNMHSNGYDQTKCFENINEEKTKGFVSFSTLSGLSNLSRLTPKELKIQKENDFFAKMEKGYQRNKRCEESDIERLKESDIERFKESKDNDEPCSKLERNNYEDKILKMQKKVDIFNNTEEVINTKNKRDNSSPNDGEYQRNNHNATTFTSSTTSNNIDYNNNATSNSIVLSKKQKWLLQNNKEGNESITKFQSQRNEPHKRLLLDGPPSPKKSHVSIMERIAQAAKQAVDDLVPEPLTESQMSESALLLKLIDIYYVQCLYSKEWKLRDKAFQFFVQEINNEKIFSDSLDVFRTMNKVILKGLNDKVSNIFNIALQLSRIFITRYASEISTSDLRNYINDLINILLEKIGDSNSRTKEAAAEALMFLATKKEIGLPIIANSLLKPSKNQTIWRPILGRLQLILVAIPTFGLQPPNKMGLQIEPLMFFIDQAFNNANGDVRNFAVKVTMEVYKLMGSPIDKYLKNVKPLVREVLTRNFEKISQEVQINQGYTNKEGTFVDVSIPPLRYASSMTKINHDDQVVGHLKECHNVIGKITSNKDENKSKQFLFREDPIPSLQKEGCIGLKNNKKVQDQKFHITLPNKKSTKNNRKLQSIAIPDQHGLILAINGHEKQKSMHTWDFDTTLPSTSNILGKSK